MAVDSHSEQQNMLKYFIDIHTSSVNQTDDITLITLKL